VSEAGPRARLGFANRVARDWQQQISWRGKPWDNLPLYQLRRAQPIGPWKDFFRPCAARPFVQCADVADVVRCVNFARHEGLPPAVRCGSHSVPGFGTCDGGLVITCDASRNAINALIHVHETEEQEHTPLSLFQRMNANTRRWSGVDYNIGMKIIGLFIRKHDQGAQTSIYLASSPEVEGLSGKYFVDCKAVDSSPRSYDQALAEKLWQVSLELTGKSA